MWETPNGIQTIKGHTRSLLFTIMDFMVAQIEDDLIDKVNIGVYDQLTRNQKINALYTVSEAFLSEAIHPPKPSAVLEGTVASIFENLKICIREEILEGDDDVFWRERILSSHKENYDEYHPDLHSLDFKIWDRSINDLRECILCDTDYLLADGLLDSDPKQNKPTKEFMGFTDDYFTLIVPDMPDDEAWELLAELKLWLKDNRRM